MEIKLEGKRSFTIGLTIYLGCNAVCVCVCVYIYICVCARAPTLTMYHH